jgi:SPP1 gp7 family putative phage head morphogenesis protein
MRNAYGNALQGVQAQLARILESIAEMEADGIPVERQTVMLAERFQNVGQDLVEQIVEFQSFGLEQTVIGQRELIDYSTDRIAQLTKITTAPLSTVGIVWDVVRPDRSALEKFVGFASNGSPLSRVFDQVGIDARSAVEQAMGRGVGPREAARMMTRVGQASYQRMETIARTEMLRAAGEANREMLMANDDVLDGWTRVCAGDPRTCAVCWALHGTEHKTSDIMPTHPNCRCVAVPKPKSIAEITGDPELDDTTPEVPGRDQLFAQLTSDEQIEVLGKGRYDLWKNGMSLTRFGKVEQDAVWGPTAVAVPLKELEG